MAEKGLRAPASHFTEEDWLDLARGQAGDREAALERHLAQGCSRCAATLRFWRSVLDLAAAEPGHAPPDAAVRMARASFTPPPRRGLAARAQDAAALVFDSFRQPLPAGVRALGASPRQMLYKAGPIAVRLRVEGGPGAERLSVVGQVVDDADPGRAMRDLAVLALSGEETVDRTLTNDLGEFQLEPVLADDLRLSVGMPGRGPLTVSLLVRTRAGGADARVLDGPGRKTTTRRQARTVRPRR
jgi:hypothetical protein